MKPRITSLDDRGDDFLDERLESLQPDVGKATSLLVKYERSPWEIQGFLHAIRRRTKSVSGLLVRSDHGTAAQVDRCSGNGTRSGSCFTVFATALLYTVQSFDFGIALNWPVSDANTSTLAAGMFFML
jgi:hypothetical protein